MQLTKIEHIEPGQQTGWLDDGAEGIPVSVSYTHLPSGQAVNTPVPNGLSTAPLPRPLHTGTRGIPDRGLQHQAKTARPG